MAQKVTVLLEDDLDGKPAEQTHYFWLGGQWYGIDLSKQNGKALESAMSRFVSAARKLRASDVPGLPRMNGVVKRPAAERKRNGDIREWAARQSPPIEIKERGRIPSAVVAQYEAAR